MAPKNKENSKRKKQMEDEGDEDYRKRRDRNNQVIYQLCMQITHVICIFVHAYYYRYSRISQAVKRSRVKSKLRTQQTLERVNQLKTENELLEEKIKMLTKELGFLKDLFIAHAGIVRTNYYQILQPPALVTFANYYSCVFLFLLQYLLFIESILHS